MRGTECQRERESDGLVLLLAARYREARRGPQVVGHWGAVHGSRRPRKAAARKGASEAAALRRCFPG